MVEHLKVLDNPDRVVQVVSMALVVQDMTQNLQAPGLLGMLGQYGLSGE